jgi:anti-sigma B factor antagonist
MTVTEPRFPVQITRGVPVVITPEEIDITNAGALWAALLHVAARPGPALVVDMTRTRFCDCAGPHALISAHKRAQAEGRHLSLAVTGAQVRRILALTAWTASFLSVPAWTRPSPTRPPPPAPARPPANRTVSNERAAGRQIAASMVLAVPGSADRIPDRPGRPAAAEYARIAGRAPSVCVLTTVIRQKWLSWQDAACVKRHGASHFVSRLSGNCGHGRRAEQPARVTLPGSPLVRHIDYSLAEFCQCSEPSARTPGVSARLLASRASSRPRRAPSVLSQ